MMILLLKFSKQVLCLIDAHFAIPIVYSYCRYGESFPVSAEALDSNFCLPIGKAKVLILEHSL